MPSTYTTRNRLEKQAPGENNGTWALNLNGNTIDLTDYALDAVVSFTLSGSKTLTTANAATDEARCRTLNVYSGTGGTVTIPNLEKTYEVRNNTSGDVTFTTGTGTSTTIKTGLIKWIFCDGANAVYQTSGPDFGSANVVTTGSGTFGSISTAGTLASGAQTVTGTHAVTGQSSATLGVAALNGNLVVSYAGASVGSGNYTSIQSGGVVSCLTSAGYPTGATPTLVFRAGVYEFYAGTGGAMPFSITSSEVRTAVGTTASAANAVIDNASNNRLLRSTSSEWYKRDIEDVEQAYLDAALSIRPVYYRSNPEHAPNDNPAHSHWGHIAEEVAAIDPRLVHYGYQDRDYETYEYEDSETFQYEEAEDFDTGQLDDDGKPIIDTRMVVRTGQRPITITGRRLKQGAVLRPDGAQYERINVLKIEALRRQNVAMAEQIAALQAAVAELQAA